MTNQLNSVSPSQPRASRLISAVLSPAVRLWLRSQVEQAVTLQVKIEGSDRQILSGYIPLVLVVAQQVIYQGLHLTHIHLTGTKIQINLGQVLRGKPLTLSEPVTVSGDLSLKEPDLNASLQAPLLSKALAEFLMKFLQSGQEALPLPTDRPVDLQDAHIAIDPDQLTLSATLAADNGQTLPLTIRTGLSLSSPQILRLDHPQWLAHRQSTRGLMLKDLHGFEVDLGSEVNLESLTLMQGEMLCQGSIRVLPAVTSN